MHRALLPGLALLLLAPWPAADAAPPLPVDHGLFGGFQANGTALEGSFVYLKANASTGHVILFSVGASRKVVVFAEVNVTPALSGAAADVTGPTWRLASRDALVTAHDTPRAVLSYKAAGAPLGVRFRPAAGVSLRASGQAGLVNVSLGADQGWIAVDGGNVSLEGGDAVVSLAARGRATFAMEPRASIWSEGVQEVEASLARGDLGAETVLARVGGQLLDAPASYGLVVRAQRANATEAALRVSAQVAAPRAVVVHLDNSTLGSDAARVEVRVDGAPALPATVRAALVPGAAPRFAAVGSGRGLTVFLGLPATLGADVLVREVPAAGSAPGGVAPAPQARPTPGPGVPALVLAAGLLALACRGPFEGRRRGFK